MAKEYKLVNFKKGDFQDNYGNYWCDAAFEGVSEPVRWVVKDPMTVEEGELYYGTITQETSKAGKEYNRFRKEQRPEATEQPQLGEQSNRPTEEYWADKQAQIRAQWAIGQAVQLYGMQREQVDEVLKAASQEMDDITYLEKQAKELYAMVDRVKGSEASMPDMTLGGHLKTEQSGYDKAKAVAAKIANNEPSKVSVGEEVPLGVYDDPKYAPDDRDVVTGGPVDLSDIPF